MISNLIKIEFKNRFRKGDSIFLKILSVIFALAFIAVEVFTFLKIDEKVVNYSNKETAFNFLVLMLMVELILVIVISTKDARKSFFSHKDYELISPLPIKNSQIIISKILYQFISQLVLNFLICTPILITFTYQRNLGAGIYVFDIIYPFVITFLTLGCSLAFVTVYQYIYRLLSFSDLAQFISTILVMIILCIIYKYALEMFLTALSDSAEGGVLNEKFINFINTLGPASFPCHNLLAGAINHTNQAFNLSMTILYIVLFMTAGLAITSLTYTYCNRHRFELKFHLFKKKTSVKSPFGTLLKKEFDLLFRNNKQFSFASYVVVLPFLCFIVIDALNSILGSNLEFITVYFPSFIESIFLCLILLFANVINASISLAISREEDCISLIKTIPVSAFNQLLAKFIIPFICSSLSLIVSCSVLFGTKIISLELFIAAIIIGLLINIFSNVFGMYIDMKSYHLNAKSHSILNTVISVIYPVLLIGIHTGLSFTKIDSIYLYLLDCIITILVIIPFTIKMKKRFSLAFSHMEVN